MHRISIAEFSPYPAGRVSANGHYNGTTFREDYLLPALRAAEEDNEVLYVSFNGIKSAGSSFLEEAFGGLVSEHGYTPPRLRKLLVFEASSPSLNRYVRAVERYIARAEPKKR